MQLGIFVWLFIKEKGFLLIILCFHRFYFHILQRSLFHSNTRIPFLSAFLKVYRSATCKPCTILVFAPLCKRVSLVFKFYYEVFHSHLLEYNGLNDHHAVLLIFMFQHTSCFWPLYNLCSCIVVCKQFTSLFWHLILSFGCCCLVTMRSWVHVLETTFCRNAGKGCVHKTQRDRTVPWTRRKRELRASGCPF
jgi:hypothetical protein